MILLHLIKILLMQEWERKQEIQNLLYLWKEMERIKRDDVQCSYASHSVEQRYKNYIYFHIY